MWRRAWSTWLSPILLQEGLEIWFYSLSKYSYLVYCTLYFPDCCCCFVCEENIGLCFLILILISWNGRSWILQQKNVLEHWCQAQNKILKSSVLHILWQSWHEISCDFAYFHHWTLVLICKCSSQDRVLVHKSRINGTDIVTHCFKPNVIHGPHAPLLSNNFLFFSSINTYGCKIKHTIFKAKIQWHINLQTHEICQESWNWGSLFHPIHQNLPLWHCKSPPPQQNYLQQASWHHCGPLSFL